MTNDATQAQPADRAAAKRRLRAEALARRDAAHASHGARPETATARLLAAIGAETPGVVASYRAMRSEIDPSEAFEALTARGATGALPCVPGRDRPLVFRRWAPGEPFRVSAFGVEEPELGEAVTPDLLIVPMLAFDRRGFRLGYGGGFYDRTLALLRAERRVRAIGFAYAAQEVERLPAEPFDAPLDLIVTEAETIAPEAAR